MEAHVVDHPLAIERLTRLRDGGTPPAEFRRALHEVSSFLIYEATRDVAGTRVKVQTPLAPADGLRIDEPPLIVPILRAGLGMLAAAQELLPTADVGFVGLKRNEETLLPDAYVTTVPPDLGGLDVLVLDPMLATGGSLVHACNLLLDHNPGHITVACVLAAPEGLEEFARHGFDATVFTASVDERLNDVGFIVPGLGDAGDRQFGVA